MTERLYYEDAYLRAFAATVLEMKDDCARLDRSAFYPTSGGQPFDTGTLGGARVLDVFVDAAGEVWHKLDKALAVGARVEGEIDWGRRFDHMQQHAGEHMLAGALWRRHKGLTIGLHLGAEVSTIDVQLPGGETRLAEEALAEIERAVNADIQRNVPIVCSFPDAATLAAMPLRKPPTIKEHVRVVAIGDNEMVACGGTHPKSAGEIGLTKILDARPSKGKMRVSFVCGMRAFRDYQMRLAVSDAAAARLSTGVEALPEAVEATLLRLKEAEYALKQVKRAAALADAPRLLAEAQPLADGWRVVVAEMEGLDGQSLRDVASALIAGGRTAALLRAGTLLLFARAAGLDCDMGALLAETAKAHGGKGGGKADFAQGSAGAAGALDYAAARLRARWG